MKKNLLAAFIAIVMLCQTVSFSNVFAVDNGAAELPEGYVVIKGFDGFDPFVASSSDCGIFTDANGENVYRIANPGTGQNESLSVNSSEIQFPEDANTQVFQFDVMFEKVDYYGRFLIFLEGQYMIYNITSDGYIVVSRGQRFSNSGTDNAVWKYEPGVWYTLTMVVDRTTHEAKFYADGVFYGMISIPYEWPAKIRKFGVQSCSGKSGVSNTMYVDNLVFGTDVDAILPSVADDCEISIECEELGQAFWSKLVDFGINVKNNTDEKRVYDVTTNLINDLGSTEFSKTDTVELETGEGTVINYEAELSRYAEYDVDVTVTDKTLDKVYQYNTELVTLKQSEEQNPQFGINDHSADKLWGYGRHDEKFAYLKKAGISSIRVSLLWADYEKVAGQFVVPDVYATVFDSINRNGLSMFFFPGMNNDNVITPSERPPASPKAISAFGKYANQLAREMSKYNVVGYEVYNEWNVVPDFNRDNLPPEAYIPLIKETSAQLKAANPNAKVYGLSGMTWNRTDLYKDYAVRMFENGLNDYSDAYTIHSYQGYQSPDTRAHYESIEYTSGLMEQYGGGNKDIVISEMGWQAVNSTPEEVVRWTVKYAAMIHDEIERIYWYTAQRKKDKNAGAGEMSYGWMQDEVPEQGYVPYAPLPQFRAVTAYNSFIANATKTDEVDVPGTAVKMYRFKRNDGNEVIMMWAKDGTEEKSYAVNIGQSTARVSDMYGNETEYNTKDGKLCIKITNEPQYLIGNFGDITFEETDFSLSASELSVVSGDICSFSVIKDGSLKNAKVELELPNNITVRENKGFKENTASVSLTIGSSPTGDSAVRVKLVDKDSGKLYYADDILIKYTDVCSIEVIPKLDTDGRWKIGISLKNLKRQGSVSGEVELLEPVFKAGEVTKYSFKNLAPQSKNTKYIYIPDYWPEPRNTVKCKIFIDNGDSFEVEDTVNLNGIIRIDKKPVIDGRISEGEWDKSMPIVLNKEKQIVNITDWGGEDDLSAKYYYNWDAENLYVAVEAKDNVLCDNPDNAIWQNDSIQFALALDKIDQGLRTEIGVGLSDGETVFERSAYIALGAAGAGNIQDDGILEEAEFKVSRDKNVTYYECKIPWEEAVDKDFDIHTCDALYVSMIVNDNDGAGRRGWIEFCTGVGMRKNAINFQKVTVFR